MQAQGWGAGKFISGSGSGSGSWFFISSGSGSWFFSQAAPAPATAPQPWLIFTIYKSIIIILSEPSFCIYVYTSKYKKFNSNNQENLENIVYVK